MAGAGHASHDPRVSVVLPTYNRGQALPAAIGSVLSQSYADLELLVVDGGSTDATPEVMASVSDARVRYVRRDEPEGVSAARNAGIERADGDLVAFIDSDDRWREDKLEKQVATLDRAGESCGAVYTGISKENGEPRTRDGASGDVYEPVRTLSVPTYTSTLLLTREALRECGGFDEELPCFEDWELCLRIARAYRFRYVDEPLVVKGTSADNISAEPERLAAALDRIERTYDLPDGTRARFLADVGVTHCEAGRLGEGRPYLWRSLRLDPRQATTLAAFALSLPGSTAVFDALMDRVYRAKRLAANLGG